VTDRERPKLVALPGAKAPDGEPQKVGGDAAAGTRSVLDRLRSWLGLGDREAATAARLDELAASGFRVLHDRPLPGEPARVAHVVIGPPGVFVVSTKHYRGKVAVSGGDVYLGGWVRDVLDRVLRQADAIGRLLATAGEEVRVVPLLCIPAARLPIDGAGARGARVVNDRGLAAFILRSPPIMDAASAERLATIVDAALQPASIRPGR
jgi:hypothetical protein